MTLYISDFRTSTSDHAKKFSLKNVATKWTKSKNFRSDTTKWFQNSVSGVQNAKNTRLLNVRQIDASFPMAFVGIQNPRLTNPKHGPIKSEKHWPMRSIDQSETPASKRLWPMKSMK